MHKISLRTLSTIFSHRERENEREWDHTTTSSNEEDGEYDDDHGDSL